MKRIIAFLVGLACITLVIFCGFQAVKNTTYVLWFGFASALIAPPGLALIGYSIFGSDRDILKRLSKVPEIKEIISRAETEEDRIRMLEQEREQLDQIVRYEAEMMALTSRKAALETSAASMLQELINVDARLEELNDKSDIGPATEQVMFLRARLKAHLNNDIVLRFGTRTLIFKRENFIALPLYGGLLYSLMKLFVDYKHRMEDHRYNRLKND